MDSENSITKYLSALKRGEPDASQKIWELFFKRLVVLARKKLASSPKRWSDEEDIVQQAFANFFVQVQAGRFPRLNNRDDLWQILAMLVDRRSTDQIRKLLAPKAGGGKVRGESAFVVGGSEYGGINLIADDLPTSDLAAEFVEELDFRLRAFTNDDYRQIAILKLQGYRNREIAEQIKSSLRTVERCLQHIREKWREGLTNESSECEQF